MDNIKLNFAEAVPKEEEKKQEKKKPKRKIPFLILFCLLIVAFFCLGTIVLEQSTLDGFGHLSFWEGTLNIIFGRSGVLAGEYSDRINILLLGMGGEGHEGPYLTDTIILLSIEPSSHTVSLLSVPRDLYIPIDGGWNKINAVYALSTFQKKDGGKAICSVIEDVFDIPVKYWAAIDFNSFIELIDWFGGVTIDVKEGFIDYSFPGPNYSYRTVKFSPGLQLMDGERVLEYVRSRHGNGESGSDFNRSARQQQVLLALKEKIKQIDILDTKQIFYFYNFFTSKIKTNLTLKEATRLAKLFQDTSSWNVRTFVLSDKNLLKPAVASNGAYILRPRTGDFKELSYLAKHIFDISEEEFYQNKISFSD
ncbi:MAG: putative transcriptional regulator YvhJ [Parcubacteria group bacterium ADurb.Bin159]|jgi:LCP family protein required for cell wall assembly|nr:MAG: putative transcriptional regulator YvhJ [Parcubacteria group bacterium ADurb.Bin159]